jgi:DNA repair photolyase
MKISTCTKRPLLTPCRLEGFEYQLDPYVGCGHYCYYCYAMDRMETDWSKEILIHEDIVGQLQKELETIPPQCIYMGYRTDPYQPVESECLQTRKTLELMADMGFSASILTKSNLMARDLDIFQKMENASLSVSVAFNNNQTRELFEANTMDTEKRINALADIHSAGINTGALLCPVIPYITDATPLIEMLAPHTDTIWIYGLDMSDQSGRNWQNVKGILNDHFPDLKESIEQVIFNKDHPYWVGVRNDLQELQGNTGPELKIHV